MSSPVILLAAEPELRDILAGAGFIVCNIDPARPATIDPRAAALVLGVSDVRAAAARTRLWRAELGDALPPLIWVLNESSKTALAAGLDAGADVCLQEPSALIAQVHAAVRSYARTMRLTARAEEARGLNERLQKAFQAAESDVALATRAAEIAKPRRLPTGGPLRVAMAHRSKNATGGHYDVARLDDHRFVIWLADIGGTGVIAGLLSLLVRSLLAGREITDAGPASPKSMLDRVNRGLIGLDRELPFVGLAYALFDEGKVKLSRSGVPVVVRLTEAGAALPWGQSGPFLGAFDAEFPEFEGRLAAEDRLLFCSCGDASQIAEVASAHRELPNQSLAEAVADNLLASQTERDGATVIAVERHV